MILKILLLLIIGVFYEIINLIRIGTIDNPVAFGFLKITIFMSLILLINAVNSMNLELLRKVKKIIPPIIETATKVLATPIKSSKKER